MSKSGGVLIAGTVVVGVLFLMSGELSTLTGSARSARKQEIVVPGGQPADEKAAIEGLVKRYYDTLRQKDYEGAVAFYEKDAFKGTGMNPAKALEAASKLTEIPRMVKVEALRIDGNRATGEILVDRQGIGAVSYIGRDLSGKTVGTWARTLSFVKQQGEWKIAKESEQSVDTADQKLESSARKMLKSLKKTQDSGSPGGPGTPARTATANGK